MFEVIQTRFAVLPPGASSRSRSDHPVPTRLEVTSSDELEEPTAGFPPGRQPGGTPIPGLGMFPPKCPQGTRRKADTSSAPPTTLPPDLTFHPSSYSFERPGCRRGDPRRGACARNPQSESDSTRRAAVRRGFLRVGPGFRLASRKPYEFPQDGLPEVPRLSDSGQIDPDSPDRWLCLDEIENDCKSGGP